MSDVVAVTDDAGVRTIRMNRPEKKNALTLAMYLRNDPRAQGSGRGRRDPLRDHRRRAGGTFCAGNDITDFLKAASGGGLDPRAHEFLLALARCRKPLVGAVRGAAIGVGTTMLLHCDHVIAGADATLSTPFLKLGLIPEAASTLLAPMRMGHSARILAAGHGPSAFGSRGQGGGHRQYGG